MYTSTLSLTSAPDGVCGPRHSVSFTPRKDPVPILEGFGWAPEPVWRGAENLAPTRIRSPDLPPIGSRYTD